MHRSDTSLKKGIITFPLNSFHFISSLYVFPLLFFKALLSELTNKLKYHCILMTDISPTPFFYGLIKFCDPKGQWNTIIIHRRVTKLYTTLFQLERCWLFVAPSSIKLMFPVYSWKKQQQQQRLIVQQIFTNFKIQTSSDYITSQTSSLRNSWSTFR